MERAEEYRDASARWGTPVLGDGLVTGDASASGDPAPGDAPALGDAPLSGDPAAAAAFVCACYERAAYPARPAQPAHPAYPAQPVRVALVLNRMDHGGIEAIVTSYALHFDAERVQADFIACEGSAVPQRAQLEAHGARVFLVPRVIRHPVAYMRACRDLFEQQRYDIVHVHMSCLSVPALLAAASAGVPVRICHAHTTAAAAEGLRALAKILLRPLCKVLATDWFACSDYVARWMYGARAAKSGGVVVVPNVVDALRFALAPNPMPAAAPSVTADVRSQVRARFGISPQAFVVGHVGRFERQKNHAFLIRAFTRAREDLAHRGVDAAHLPVLLLVGEGRGLSAARAQAARADIADAVVFVGACADTAPLYHTFDLFALPSLYEGMPLVVPEALYAGVPVVVSTAVHTDYDDALTKLPLRVSLWAEAIERAATASSSSRA